MASSKSGRTVFSWTPTQVGKLYPESGYNAEREMQASIISALLDLPNNPVAQSELGFWFSKSGIVEIDEISCDHDATIKVYRHMTYDDTVELTIEDLRIRLANKIAGGDVALISALSDDAVKISCQNLKLDTVSEQVFYTMYVWDLGNHRRVRISSDVLNPVNDVHILAFRDVATE